MKYFYRVAAITLLIAGSGICQPDPSAGSRRIADEPPLGAITPQPPPLSPPAQTSVTIARQKIIIKYSAPSMRKRVIFGELVPYHRVWRAGANDATLLHTTADLDFNGLLVPKGDYSLFVWPDPQQWILIINKQTGQSGLEYHPEMDLGRAPMDLVHVPKAVERFRITLGKGTGTNGQLQMTWENTAASIGFTVLPSK